MNKQDNRVGLSVVATLVAGIALIYTLIMYPQIIFAVAGTGLLFIITAYILTQNILSYLSNRQQTMNAQMQNYVDDLTSQINTMESSRAQLEKATFLYTKQTAQILTTLENNYAESQEALYKNLTALSNAQNKSTKLMIKYDQSNTTKVISTLKDLRNQLSDTMIQGFDQIQPNNNEVVSTLEDIITYLKTQPAGMDQSMGLQLNNVAHELQNISNSIQHVQVNMSAMPQVAMPVATPVMPATQPVATEAPIIEETSVEEMLAPELDAMEEPIVENTAQEAKDSLDAMDLEDLFASIGGSNESVLEESIVEDVVSEVATTTELPTEEASIEETLVEEVAEAPAPAMEMDDPNKQLSADEIAALFAAAEPAPKKEPEPVEETVEEVTEEEPFTPTFTVVGKEDPVEEVAETPAPAMEMDDPNKQLSADEIAALFAAADPAPKKPEKVEEPAPVAVEPLSDDPNKQLSADEIAALFAAAEPAPKKEPEPVKVEPISDDPNKQLSADEIAALFASLG